MVPLKSKPSPKKKNSPPKSSLSIPNLWALKKTPPARNNRLTLVLQKIKKKTPPSGKNSPTKNQILQQNPLPPQIKSPP